MGYCPRAVRLVTRGVTSIPQLLQGLSAFDFHTVSPALGAWSVAQFQQLQSVSCDSQSPGCRLIGRRCSERLIMDCQPARRT